MNIEGLETVIHIQRAEKSRLGQVDFNQLPFGKIFTDHMYICEFDGANWSEGRILPYGNINISPALSAIHYGQSLFEGMKAYKMPQGDTYLFRPEDNWSRLNNSARRLCMREVPHNLFMEALTTLVKLDNEWIPTQSGSALYIRPFLFASDECVGVRPSEKYVFMIICCPVNAFYSKPLRLKAEDFYVRAVEGGTGEAKAAGNYGASMLPTRLAQHDGYDQIMWLDGREKKYVEESGTMNLFFVINGVLTTPDLRGTILNGFTRDTVIQLAHDLQIPVEEKRVSINELIQANENGFLTEMFGTGTAATVIQMLSFDYLGKRYEIPSVENRPVSNKIVERLEAIKSCKYSDSHHWMYKI